MTHAPPLPSPPVADPETPAEGPHAGLLRFTTAGSVDDGKSTLIGRLLYDAKSIFEDQLEAVQRSSKQRGDADVNLALLTDGLRAEREQGITIDVAYRYFATPRRKFVIADTPGHVQYTRNMVTGASTADLAIVLIDARQGVVEQTRRHAFIANLLRIRHVVIAINKMDLVGFERARFDELRRAIEPLQARLGSIRDWTMIPISAKHGDNVVERSAAMPWYGGPTLLEHLEQVEVDDGDDPTRVRLPVQWVIRPQSDEHHDFRGYAGRVSGGALRVGDPVVVLPAGLRSLITSIHLGDQPLEVAQPGQSVAVTLADDVDVGRGDLLARADHLPACARELTADLCWLGERPAEPRGRYLLRQGPREVQVSLQAIESTIDLASLEPREAAPGAGLTLNELARVRLRAAAELATDPYEHNRATGSFVLIDPQSCATVAAGMVRG
jgi:sulfate adenylyltransferase large subunit